MIAKTYNQINKVKDDIENILIDSELVLTEKNVEELEQIRDSLECFEIGEE